MLFTTHVNYVENRQTYSTTPNYTGGMFWRTKIVAKLSSGIVEEKNQLANIPHEGLLFDVETGCNVRHLKFQKCKLVSDKFKNFTSVVFN